jgi:hypothetical protein
MLRTWRCAGCFEVMLDDRCECYADRVENGTNTGNPRFNGVWLVPDGYLIVQDRDEER